MFNSNRQKKVVINHDFPITELSGSAFILFALTVSVVKYIDEKTSEWIFLILFLICGLYFFYRLINWRNKKIIFEDGLIKIKPFFKINSIIYNKKDIVGFFIIERYTNTGLNNHILLVTKIKKYEFVKDAYSDYEKLQKLFENKGISYLGKREIKWKYKKHYGILSAIAGGLIIILFILLQLLK
jgi:hypothetical protein